MLLTSMLTLAQTVTGSLGDNATYTISDNVLTISGTGALPDYTRRIDKKTGTLVYTSPLLQTSVMTAMQNVTAVIIGDGITSIGSYTLMLPTTGDVGLSLPCTLVPANSKSTAIQLASNGTIAILAPANSAAYTDYAQILTVSSGVRPTVRSGRTHASVKTIRAVAATCTTAGNNQYYQCLGCKQYATTSSFSKLTTVAAQQLEPLGHDMTHFDLIEPTCTEEGTVAYYECTRCSNTFVDAEGTEPLGKLFIEPLGHAMTHHDIIEPTCTEEGTVAHYACTRCSNHFVDAEGAEPLMELLIEPLGHQPVFHDAVSATCLAEGTKAYYECQRCSNTYSDEACTTPLADLSTPTLNHTPEYVPYQAATCSRAGNSAYYRCTGCGGASPDMSHCVAGVFSDPSEYIKPRLPHLNITPFAALQPTCTRAGRIQYYRCNICSTTSLLADCSVPVDYDTEISIPALGHDLTHYDAEAATCTAYGHTDYDKCTRCNKFFTIDAETGAPLEATYAQFRNADPLGHDMTKVSGYAKTCTTDGLKQHYHCNRCDNYYIGADGTSEIIYSELIIPASHAYVYQYGSTPGCTTPGVESYYNCWDCRKEFVKEDDGTYTELTSHDSLVIPALGHSLHNLAHEWVTSSADGMPEMWYCDRCRKFSLDADLTVNPTAQDIYPTALRGTGTADDPYIIATEGDLKAMALASNYQWNTAGLYFDVTHNITVTGHFQSICSDNTTYPFRGNIRGHHHTITFDGATSIRQGSSKGFVGRATNASITNLTLRGTIDWDGSYQSNVGSFCGSADNCQFQGLRNYIAYSNNFLATSCGAIAGYAYACQIQGCENHAPLKSLAQYFGGLVGQASNTTILNSSNEGSIITGGRATAYVGGLAGSLSHANGGTVLANSYNASYVAEDDNSSSKYMGYLFGTLTSGYVRNCLYQGEGTLPLGFGQTSGVTNSNVTNCHSRTLNDNLSALNATATAYGYEPWVRNASATPRLLFAKQQPHYLNGTTTTSLADLTLLIKWLNQDDETDTYWQCDYNKDGIFNITDLQEVKEEIMK